MVFDCFIFNDELDMLELRLRFLDNIVDRFVLVESERTLSGERKDLHFENNKLRFSGFSGKITHLVAPANDMGAWEYEFFQRNFIKQGLINCSDEDIVLIADVDEIINLSRVLGTPDLELPVLIEIPMFNYFFNVETDIEWRKNLLATWGFLKDKDIDTSEYMEKFTNEVYSIINWFALLQ